jgi:AcrR family transcriptional regulator
MIDASGRGFRQYGYSGIGVDGLAKEAGVTSGAFYAHFGSKEAAFTVALEAGLEEVIEGIPKLQKDQGADWVRGFAEYYLGKKHLADLACGCAMATLTQEVARSGPKAQIAFEKQMIRVANLVSRGLAGGTEEDRQSRAWAMLGVLIGGINIARAMKNRKIANEVANSIVDAAVKAAGRARPSPIEKM